MSAHFPDHETVYTALSLATRAPSVHNTQPWRWRVGSASLHLYAEPELHLPSTDPDGRDLILSCGIRFAPLRGRVGGLGMASKGTPLPNQTTETHCRRGSLPSRIQRGRHHPSGSDPAAAHRPAPLQLLERTRQLHRADGRSRGARRGDAAASRGVAPIADILWSRRFGATLTDRDYLTS